MLLPPPQLKLPQLSGDPAPTMSHLFVAGGTAGFMYWVLFYPLDVLKSAMQTDALVPSERRYRGIANAASSLWAEGGVARFYKGVTPCLLRAVPANAVMLITVVRHARAARLSRASPRADALLPRRADQSARAAGAVMTRRGAAPCCTPSVGKKKRLRRRRPAFPPAACARSNVCVPRWRAH